MKSIILILLTLSMTMLGAAPLGLNEARERAMQANLDWQSQQAAHSQAQWGYRQSLFGLLPSASLTGSYGKYDPIPGEQQLAALGEPEDNTIEYGVQVSMPLFVGGAKWLGSRMQHDALLIADQSLLAKRLEVLAEVESKYYAVLEARDLLHNAEIDLRVSRTNLESAEVRHQLGTLSRADYLRMQSETAGKEVSVIQQRNLLEIARLELADYLQVPADFTLLPIDEDDLSPAIGHLRGLGADAVEQLAARMVQAGVGTSPSLRMAQIGRDAKAKSLWMARGAFLPTLSLAWSKTWTDGLEHGDDFADQTVLMLNASVPLFPLADNYAAERSARRGLQQAQLDLAAAEDGVRLGLRSAVLNLVTAAQAVHASQIALDYAAETYSQMEERYRNNLVSTNDLLNVEVLLLTSRNTHTTSLYNYLRARSALARQMGVDEPTLQNWIQ